MDTERFTEFSSEEYKEQTRKNWTEAPCGSNYGVSEFGSKEYFEQVEEHRYRTHPWIKRAINSFDIVGKDVLEIGFGMGTDHLNLARRGARMSGLDLTPRNREVTAGRLELCGMKSRLLTGDAERMPFADDSFDFVYSFGVIHHSPDTEAIVREIRRVLKPGGTCWLTVYHKNSLFFWWTVFLYAWLLMGGFRKETLKQRISRVEHPNTNPNLVIKLYDRKGFTRLFEGFSEVRITVEHLVPEDVAWFGRLIPGFLRNRLAKRMGWYLIASARK